MLPDYLRDSYKTYKRDTDTIANWLATTAKRCGFSPEVLNDSDDGNSQPPGHPSGVPSSRLKGKARKLARDVAARDDIGSTSPRTYTIPIRSFTRLASQIVASSTKPHVVVPAALDFVLDRVIAFRKEHNTWFKNTKLATAAPADGDSHAYFISVLEHVRHILRPHMAERIRTQSMKESLANSEQSKNATPRNDNAFEALEVEELSDTFLNASISETVPECESDPSAHVRYRAESLRKKDEHFIDTVFLLESINSTLR